MIVDELAELETRASTRPTAGTGRRASPIAVLGLLVLSGLAYLSVRGTAAPFSPEGGRPQALDFAAPSFSGEEIQLAQWRGQPVVLNFWASWCAPCRAEAPDLERVWQAYRERGVVFVGVDIQDNEPEARAFLRDTGVSYPNVVDPTNEVAVGYAVRGIPATIFIDREGRIVSRWVGPLTEQRLVARVEELLR